MNRDIHNVLFRAVGALAGAALLLLTTSLPAFADENATLHGKTIGEWSARWWKWQEANFPDFEFGGTGLIDCSIGQSGPVWFLGGTGGDSAERECFAPIKGHKHLMFPLVNASLFNEPNEPDPFCVAAGFPDCMVDDKRIVLDGIFSEDPPGIFNTKACLLHAEVDGIPAVGLAPIVRTQSPPFEYASDAETVADGFWVVLPPLSSGEHVIHFTGGLCDIDTGDVFFDVEVTYTLTVL